MIVQITYYMRRQRIIPATRYLRTDAFGTCRTQERRRPDRTDALVVQKRYNERD